MPDRGGRRARSRRCVCRSTSAKAQRRRAADADRRELTLHACAIMLASAEAERRGSAAYRRRPRGGARGFAPRLGSGARGGLRTTQRAWRYGNCLTRSADWADAARSTRHFERRAAVHEPPTAGSKRTGRPARRSRSRRHRSTRRLPKWRPLRVARRKRGARDLRRETGDRAATGASSDDEAAAPPAASLNRKPSEDAGRARTSVGADGGRGRRPGGSRSFGVVEAVLDGTRARGCSGGSTMTGTGGRRGSTAAPGPPSTPSGGGDGDSSGPPSRRGGGLADPPR